MSRESWENEVSQNWEQFNNSPGRKTYLKYATSCSAFVSSKFFSEAGEHWFCSKSKYSNYAITSLYILSHTASDDDLDAQRKFNKYESALHSILSNCIDCAIEYEKNDLKLESELIRHSTADPSRVKEFIKYLQGKNRIRLMADLSDKSPPLAVLAEFLWSAACFINDGARKLFIENIESMHVDKLRDLPIGPGLLLWLFFVDYKTRSFANKTLFRDIKEFGAVWTANKHRFTDCFINGIRRSKDASRADLGWFSCWVIIKALNASEVNTKELVRIAVREMKSASGVPGFGAHALLHMIYSRASSTADLVNLTDLAAITDYVCSNVPVYNKFPDNLPESALKSSSYRNMSGTAVVNWFKEFMSLKNPVDQVVKRIQYLIDLGEAGFEKPEDYKAALNTIVRGFKLHPRAFFPVMSKTKNCEIFSREYQNFSENSAAELWAKQINCEFSPFWDMVLDKPAFNKDLIANSERVKPLIHGILRSSQEVAFVWQIPQRSDNNTTLRAKPVEKFIQKLLEMICDSGNSDFAQFLVTDSVVLPQLLLLSVSGNRELALASDELLKMAFDVSSRAEYLNKLATEHVQLCLKSLNAILKSAKSADSKWVVLLPGVIKLAISFLDEVYSIRDGVDMTKNSQSLNLLLKFWTLSWEVSANVVANVKVWARLYSVSHLKLVLSETLGFSKSLLEKFRLIDADLSQGLDSNKNWGNELAQPAINSVVKMGDMLQLAVPELLTLAYEVILAILKLMSSFKVDVPSVLSNLFKNLATEATKHKLSKDQIRELLMAANFSDESIRNLEASKRSSRVSSGSNGPNGTSRSTSGESAAKQTQLSTSSTAPSTFHPVLKPTGGKQKAISEFWGRSEGNKLEIPKRTIINNQVVPSAPAQSSHLNAIKEQLRQSKHHTVNRGVPLTVHPAREPGFNPKKPVAPSKKSTSSSESSDSEDNSDNEGGALGILGAKNIEESAAKLREATAKKNKAGMVLLEDHADTYRRVHEDKERAKRVMKARLSVEPTELHKELLLWDYYAKESPVNSNISVPDKFTSVDHYQKVMKPLLYLEAWEQLQRSKDEIQQSGAEIVPLVFGKRIRIDQFTDVYVSAPKQLFTKASLGESDILVLGYDKSNVNSTFTPREHLPHALARIKEGSIKFGGSRNSEKNYVDFQIRFSGNPQFLIDMPARCNVSALSVGNLRTVEREFTALMALKYYELVDPILTATPLVSKDNDGQISEFERRMGLNKSQATAVSRSMSGKGFGLIQGPPGTGKTKTILGIIGAFFSTQAVSADQPKKILVCAPSNAAVDEIVLRLKQGVTTTQGSHMDLNILRLGRAEMISEQVRDVTLEEKVSKAISNTAEPIDEQLRKDHTALTNERNNIRVIIQNKENQLTADDIMNLESKLRDISAKIREKNRALDMQRDRLEQARKQKDLRFREEQNDILQKAQVVCTTLSASAHPLLASLNLTFDTVIIDEAAQCIELSAIIPLKYGCVRCIMVGDPNQLPPTVISKRASDLKYQQSLFVRMYNQHKSNPGAISMLDTQFRMHPEISKFPSIEFYDGKLKDGSGLAKSLYRPWHTTYQALSPYNFFEVQGQHEKGNSKSLKNLMEANAAVDLVKFLINNFTDVGSIGVISPYREQVRVIKQMFIDFFGADITLKVDFNSVDGFQGQEKDIIIFSCVRADFNPNSGIGFVGDIRRMNVAITRAKSSLWILGNSFSLVANPVWKALIEDAQHRNKFCSVGTKGITRAILDTKIEKRDYIENQSKRRRLDDKSSENSTADKDVPTASKDSATKSTESEAKSTTPRTSSIPVAPAVPVTNPVAANIDHTAKTAAKPIKKKPPSIFMKPKRKF